MLTLQVATQKGLADPSRVTGRGAAIRGSDGLQPKACMRVYLSCVSQHCLPILFPYGFLVIFMLLFGYGFLVFCSWRLPI